VVGRRAQRGDAVVTGLAVRSGAVCGPGGGAIPAAATRARADRVEQPHGGGGAEIEWQNPKWPCPPSSPMAIPLTFSIAQRLAFGFTAYTLIKVARQVSQVNWFVYALTALFIARFVYLVREGRRPRCKLDVLSLPRKPGIHVLKVRSGRQTAHNPYGGFHMRALLAIGCYPNALRRCWWRRTRTHRLTSARKEVRHELVIVPYSGRVRHLEIQCGRPRRPLVGTGYAPHAEERCRKRRQQEIEGVETGRPTKLEVLALARRRSHDGAPCYTAPWHDPRNWTGSSCAGWSAPSASS